MIVVKDLKKNYNGLDVLKGIDLTINKGDVVCLVGPSGCGKSTFLRCLTRLEEPDGGTVMLDGKEITNATLMPPAPRWAWCSSILTCSLT